MNLMEETYMATNAAVLQTTESLMRTIEALVELQTTLRKAVQDSMVREKMLAAENERLRAKCMQYENRDIERRRYEEEG
jgi:hypothetical protein